MLVLITPLLTSCGPGKQYHEVGLIYPEALDENVVRAKVSELLSGRGYSKKVRKSEAFWVNKQYQLKFRIDSQFRSLVISNHQEYIGGHSGVNDELNAIRDDIHKILYRIVVGDLSHYGWELHTTSGPLDGLIAEIKSKDDGRTLLLVFLLGDREKDDFLYMTPVEEEMVTIRCGKLEYDRKLQWGSAVEWIFSDAGEHWSRDYEGWITVEDREALVEQLLRDGHSRKKELLEMKIQ